MANKPSPSRQHKHLAVLIDADNALVVIAEDLLNPIKRWTSYALPTLQTKCWHGKFLKNYFLPVFSISADPKINGGLWYLGVKVSMLITSSSKH